MAQVSDRQVRKQLRAAVAAAVNKKAADSVLLDVRKLSGFTDYFYICQGSNTRQVQAIADAIDMTLDKEYGVQAAHREGYEHAEWIVLDYVDFVIHIFTPASRAFYGLERLWSKAAKVDPMLAEPVTPSDQNSRELA